MFALIKSLAKNIRNLRDCVCAGRDGIYDLRPYQSQLTEAAIRATAARSVDVLNDRQGFMPFARDVGKLVRYAAEYQTCISLGKRLPESK